MRLLLGGLLEGEDSKDYAERDERRLGELGRRTVEMYSMAHIFSELEVGPLRPSPCQGSSQQ